ncbi:hypothetical protein TMEN_8429 [Trichophyton mentagrophytes]|uniref:Uncharacterized protein n=1 Tax=Trichophyton interdigitale (strain MR816) TaxID=1215338 RepID=A0A059J8X7_TRIIM|nr:hypothetical protein H101_02054 [Trichophyton interdigitale H6]KDB24295.1 hypothetical protein H109_03838 [Trichophyton interdigitale MR816]GBF65711.1 hypothetical protein TMEN_8429 [Trichophyton mentagrophytes]
MRRYFLVALLLLYLTVGAASSTSSDRSDFHQRVADVEFADSLAAYLRRNLDGNPLQILIPKSFLYPITMDGQPVLGPQGQRRRAKRFSPSIKQSPIKNIISMESIILLLHVIGAAESAEQIIKLCETVNFNRITDNGLDGAMLESMICKRNDLEFYIPANSDAVKELLSTWYMGLWMQILYVAFAGHYPDLCKIFETKKMSIINMNGTFLEQILCSL